MLPASLPACREVHTCSCGYMGAAPKQELGVELLVGCVQRAFKVLRASWWT